MQIVKGKRGISFIGLLLTTLPALTYAQSDAPTEPFPRWYGGLQFGRQTYQLFVPRQAEIGMTNARRLQFTIGYQLKPRLAVQLGLAPGQQEFTTQGAGTNDAGEPVTERSHSEGRSLAVPLQLRYTVGPTPLKNLHFDLLAGGVVFRSRNETSFMRTENGITTTNYHTITNLTNAFITLGPSIRYSFGRHVDALADWQFTKNLRSTSAGNNVYSVGNKSGITNSLNLGIRYRFNYR